MVKHIIFFTLKPEAPLMPLVGKIPGLTKMEVKESFAGADFVLYSELESREALAVYADHPLHLAAKTHFFPWVQTRTAADYEVSEERMTKAVVTVVGKDRVGIIANVCTALAGFQVNVLDINGHAGVFYHDDGGGGLRLQCAAGGSGHRHGADGAGNGTVHPGSAGRHL